MSHKNIIGIIIIAVIGLTMFGLFKKQKTKLSTVHLCPSVKGQILDNGKPVVGETVYRHLVYIDNVLREDNTITDEHGNFSMPAVSIESDIPNNPFAEHNTNQAIFLKNNRDDLTFLWSVNMPGKELLPEFSRKLDKLKCDIKDEEVNFEFKYDDHPVLTYYGSTICRWKNDFNIY